MREIFKGKHVKLLHLIHLKIHLYRLADRLLDPPLTVVDPPGLSRPGMVVLFSKQSVLLFILIHLILHSYTDGFRQQTFTPITDIYHRHRSEILSGKSKTVLGTNKVVGKVPGVRFRRIQAPISYSKDLRSCLIGLAFGFENF